jgi:hypothetical protein
MKFTRIPPIALAALAAGILLSSTSRCTPPRTAHPATPSTAAVPNPNRKELWRFAVSGDSRNCGDVVMPAIAQGVHADRALFYWHLGDVRDTYDFDEDIVKATTRSEDNLTISNYVGDVTGTKIGEWEDVKQNQVAHFGAVPFFLGIGNHETIFPQSRERFTQYFAEFLDRPELKNQRLKDLGLHRNQDPGPRTYYHWNLNNVDFIYLDNASKEQFSPEQVKWFEDVLSEDDRPEITTIVVAMHAALPNSIAKGHSMNQWPDGERSGAQIYRDLLKRKNAGKKVYVLASHSHFFMDGIFNTKYWKSHGGVLDGWIVGTAGAVRYRLPGDADRANAARTDVYGYLLGTVNNDGSIDFNFHQISEKDVPASVSDRYPPDFVRWCFVENKR